MSFGLEMTFLGFVGISLHASLLLNHIFCRKTSEAGHTQTHSVFLLGTHLQVYLSLIYLSLTHTLSLPMSLTLTHSRKLTALFSLYHWHTHTHTHTLSPYLPLSLSKKATTLPIFHTLSHKLIQTYISLSLSITHTHTRWKATNQRMDTPLLMLFNCCFIVAAVVVAAAVVAVRDFYIMITSLLGGGDRRN